MAESDYPKVINGPGYAIGDLAALGEGPGFRKVRRGLGVTAFGVNAVVMPAGYESGFHAHEHQEDAPEGEQRVGPTGDSGERG